VNELQRLENLLDQLIDGIERVLNSGEILSDEFQGLLAEQLGDLNNRIQELYQSEETGIPPIEDIEEEQAETANAISPPEPPTPPGNGAPIPPLEPAPHPSSNINAFRYEPENKKLYVKFQGKYPQENGPVYSYEGVPQNIFNVFSRGSVAPRTSGRNAWHTWKEGVTPSHGASMYALIREGGYPYQRLS
jgi:KTSC domain